MDRPPKFSRPLAPNELPCLDGNGVPPGNQGLLSTIVNNSFLTLAGTVGGKLLFFLTQVVIVQIFGFRYFGLLIMGLRTTELTRIFSSIGMPKGGMRFLSMAVTSREKRGEIPGILFTCLCVPLAIGIPMATALYALSPMISNHLLNAPLLTPYLRILAIAVPFAIVTHLGIDLSRAFRTTKYAVLIENILLPAGRFGLFLLLFLILCNFYSAVLATTFAYMLGTVAAFGVIHKLLRRFYGREWQPVNFLRQCRPGNFRLDIVRYSLPLFLSGCSGILLGSTDILMLGYFKNPEAVGIYGAALTMATTFSTIMIRSMHSTFAPVIAGEFGRGNRDGMKAVYFANVRWMFYVALPFTAVMVLAREPILLAYGKGALVKAGWVIAILSLGQMLNCVTGGGGHLLSMTGQQMKELMVNLLSVAINIVLNFLFIPRYGIIGAAWATTLSQITLNILPLLIVRHIYGLQPFTRRLARLLGIWILLMLGGLFLESRTSSLIAHLGIAGTVAVVIVGFIWWLGLDADDTVLFKNFLNRLRRLGPGGPRPPRPPGPPGGAPQPPDWRASRTREPVESTVSAIETPKSESTPVSVLDQHTYLIIGGTLKAGTTSLFNYLADHPDVCPSSAKETYFFQNPERRPANKCSFVDGMDTYETYFHHAHCGEGCKLRLEATPQYLYYPETPELIRKGLADAHVVFLLRDPVERLVSCFDFERQHAMFPESVSFEDYVALQMDGTPVPGLDPQKVHSLEQGCYSRYLKPYLESLGADHVHVYLFNELKQQPKRVVRELCAACNLDPAFFDEYDFKVFNPTRSLRNPVLQKVYKRIQRHVQKNISAESKLITFFRFLQRMLDPVLMLFNSRSYQKTDVPDAVRERLAQYYQKESRELATLLGRDKLPWG